MAKRPSRPSAAILSGRSAQRFPSRWEVDFGRLAFYAHDLSIEGRWALREGDEPPTASLTRTLERYLKGDDFVRFLGLTIEGGSWTSIARLTAAMGKPSVSVKRLAGKRGPSWQVKALLRVAIADEAFDGAGWAKAVPEMLAYYQMSSEYMSGGESLPLTLAPRSVRARARALDAYLPVHIKASFRSR